MKKLIQNQSNITSPTALN